MTAIKSSKDMETTVRQLEDSIKSLIEVFEDATEFFYVNGISITHNFENEEPEVQVMVVRK